MSENTEHRARIAHRHRGIALLMVLMIVLVVTILSAGFMIRADVELACGQSMLLRLQMDQVANSGLEHAKGLLLRPQPLSATYVVSANQYSDWYWEGGTGLQLVSDTAGCDDYYDVTLSRDATDYCTFLITSSAYRENSSGEEIGRTTLGATLRVDPCMGLWTKTNMIFRPNWVLHGDLCANGSVVNQAATESLDGDVFATSLTGTSVGQKYPVRDPSFWPLVTSTYANHVYATQPLTAGTTMSGTYESLTRRIYHCKTGDITLGDDASPATITGMLFVTTGNVTVAGSDCNITTVRNLPALYVGGNLVLENASNLTIKGLAVVGGDLRIRSDVSNVQFIGGLFVTGRIIETTPDTSGNGLTADLVGDPQWQAAGALGGSLTLDGVDDCVDCGDDSALDIAGPITVGLSVQTERVGEAVVEPLVVNGAAYWLAMGSSNIEFVVYNNSTSVWQGVQVPISSTFNGVWHHIAGTFDGATVSLYLDGVSQATSVYNPTIALSDPNVYLGSDGANCYQGALDDVRIYDRALSETEIGQIAAGETVSDLVVRWPLNGPGSNVTIVADPIGGAIVSYVTLSLKQYWSPASGAFFRRIERP